MTEKEQHALLVKALDELKLTTQGYVQWVADGKPATHWSRAMLSLNKLEKELRPSPVPNLGPVWIGGKSVLEHDLTHATAGIPLYPAFDDAFNQGRVVIAPEALTVTDQSGANPGEAFYCRGTSRLLYWFGHLDRSHPTGTKFSKGASIGRVAANNIGGGPHVHVGINVELIAGDGKQLLHHTDYTHGAPTVGEQLRRIM